MVKFIWHNGEVPAGEYVKQVYGVVFTRDGRIMLEADKMTREYFEALSKSKGKDLLTNAKITNKPVFCLIGGTVEEFDANREATLRREVLEEANITLGEKVCMVGYQEIFIDDKREPYVQIRMTAVIEEIGPKMPDPDSGIIHDRILVPPMRAIELLNWDGGEKLITEATKVAKEQLGIELTNQEEEWV